MLTVKLLERGKQATERMREDPLYVLYDEKKKKKESLSGAESRTQIYTALNRLSRNYIMER